MIKHNQCDVVRMMRTIPSVLRLLLCLMAMSTAPSVLPQVVDANLTVALSAGPDPVRAGEVVQYAVTVTNRYASGQHLYVYAQVPDHTTVAQGAISAGGGCAAPPCGAGQTISWDFSYVAAGQSVTAQYAARVDTVNPPAAGTVLRSTVTAVASGTGASAAAAVDVQVAGSADLAMGMTVTPGSVAPGGTLSYVLTFGNPNATSGPAAVLSVPVPAGATFVSASDGGALVGGVVQWNVGALAAGASGQRQFAVQVGAGVPEKNVIVAAADLRDASTGRSLARGNAVAPVLSAPGLLTALSAGPDPVRAGEVVQYAVTVTNRYANSQHLYVYAQVPDHTTVALSAVSGNGSCGATSCVAGQTIRWDFGYVAAGQSVTAQYAARVDTVNPPAAGTVLRSTVAAVASGAGASAVRAVDIRVGTVTIPSLGGLKTLSGFVVDADTRAPLAGAVVLAGDDRVTDANGYYSFTELFPGLTAVSAAMSGYVTSSTTVDTGLTSRLDLALVRDYGVCSSGTVSGTVSDGGTHKKLAGITVKLGASSTVTNSVGAFSFSGVPASVQTITVSAIGYLAIAQKVSVCGNTTQAIALTKAATTQPRLYPSGKSADPVNTATGNYTLQRVDLKLPGRGFGFAFERGYNSQDPLSGPLGYGWTHNFNASLALDGDGNAVVRWGDGGTERV